jgi:hypothetical protein
MPRLLPCATSRRAEPVAACDRIGRGPGAPSRRAQTPALPWERQPRRRSLECSFRVIASARPVPAVHGFRRDARRPTTTPAGNPVPPGAVRRGRTTTEVVEQLPPATSLRGRRARQLSMTADWTPVFGNDRSRTPRQFVLGAVVDAGEDAAAVEGELLVDAVLANQLRSQPRNGRAPRTPETKGP